MAPDDPEILLEMAWTHFYLGDSRKCLGLLIALDAPVHATYISPERFLLEALALRRLCQFGAAREAATRLEAKYEASLTALAAGTLPQDIPEMRTVALLRGRRRPFGASEKPTVDVPLTGDRVFYPFSGEYWTDELDDLLVIAEDRCID
jgi:hypothetical protein